MSDSKCTTIKTQDDLPDGDTAIQYTTTDAATLTDVTLLATVITQSGAHTSGTLDVGQWGADISSGGTMYYRATEGIFTLTSSLTLSS